MKKQLLTILALGATLIGSAQTHLMENFAFTNDSLAAVGANNGWVIASGGTTNALRANSPALTYTGYFASGLGNGVPITTSGQDVVKDTKVSYANNSVYASLMVRPTAAQAAGDYFFGLLPTGSTTLFAARTFIRLSSPGFFRVGISKSSVGVAETLVYSNDSFALNQTYVFVVKYTFVSGTTNDSAALYVFSSGVPATEPSTPTTTNIANTNTDLVNVNRVFLRQGTAANAPSLIVGGIRVAQSWGDGPLPVEYLSFEGKTMGDQNILTWATSTEINNKGFIIERSFDGNNFERIGFVEGIGNSMKVRNYEFVDNTGSTVAYYRLRQLDFDGKEELSKVVIINREELEVAISPNPFEDRVIVEATEVGTTIEAEIFDINGKLKLSAHAAGRLVIDTKDLTSGIYFIKLVQGNKTQIKRIVRN